MERCHGAEDGRSFSSKSVPISQLRHDNGTDRLWQIRRPQARQCTVIL